MYLVSLLTYSQLSSELGERSGMAIVGSTKSEGQIFSSKSHIDHL